MFESWNMAFSVHLIDVLDESDGSDGLEICSYVVLHLQCVCAIGRGYVGCVITSPLLYPPAFPLDALVHSLWLLIY